jgi:hypothetical protein
VLVYLPVVWGQIIFFRDAAHWNYPARWFLHDAFARGDSSAWNPFEGLGLPVRANPLYGIHYPPNWIFLLTPAGLVASMVMWQTFAHLVWGSVGTALLARRFGAAPAGVVVAGLAWGLSGYVTTGWSAGLLLPAAAWVPWTALGFARLARAAAAGERLPGPIAAAGAPVAMALLFGEVFVAIMAVAFALATAAAALRFEDGARTAAPWRRWALGSAAALGLAGLVGAVVVLPARLLARGNVRADVLPRAMAEACSMHPMRLLEMVVPGVMGYPYSHFPGAAVIGEPTLENLPLFYGLYLGATVVALALAALGRRRAFATALAACALFALLVGMGKYTPVHQALRTIVRPLAFMRYPEKYVILPTTWVALLAGVGATRLLSAGATRPWRRALPLLGLVVALDVGARALFPADWLPWVIHGAVHAAVALLALLAAAYLAPRWPRAAAAVLLLAVAVDLGSEALPHLAFAPPALATHTPASAAAVLRDHETRAPGAPPRVYRADRVELEARRFSGIDNYAVAERPSVETLIANTAITFGLATVPGYDAAIPSSLVAFWRRSLKEAEAVLRLFGVEYVVLPISDPGDRVEHRTWLEPMMDPVPGSRLYRVPRPLPRVYLAGRAEVTDDDSGLGRLLEPAVIDGGLALLAPGEAPLAGEAGRAGVCRIEGFANTHVTARCRADRRALAVFVEQHDPGWRAQVDGRPVPLLRANVLMRAVAVEPGEHRIDLAYEVPGATPAGALSLLGAAGLAALALAHLLAGRRARAG